MQKTNRNLLEMLPKEDIHCVEFSEGKLSNYELITYFLLIKVLKLIMSRQQNCFKPKITQ